MTALATVLLLLALPVVALALATPIYSDEIVWKIIHARYVLDHGMSTNAFPQCGPSFLVPVPWTHVPAALLDAVLHQDLTNPLKLRIVAVLGMLGLLALTVVLLLTAAPRIRLATAVALVLAFWGIGALPLLLALSRPELPLLLGLTALALMVARRDDPRARRWSEAARFILYVALVDLLLATHPKMLLFVPLLVVAGWLVLDRAVTRLAAGAILVLVAAQTHTFANARGACPDSPWTAQQLSRVMLDPASAVTAPAAFGEQVLENVFESVRYADGLTPAHSHLAEWTEGRPSFRAADRLIYAVTAMIAVWVVVLTLVALADLARTRTLASRRWLFLGLVASLLVFVGLQTLKNSYDGEFVFALSALAILLGTRGDAPVVPSRTAGTVSTATKGELSARSARGRMQVAARVRNLVLAAVVVTAVVSEARLLATFGPLAVGEWLDAAEFPARSEGWTSGFGYAGVRDEVRRMALVCGIDVTRRPRFLVVDDMTYPALTEATYPIHTMGITWWGQGIASQDALLKAVGSEGVVARCRSLMPELARRARRNGALCCLPTFVEPASPPA